MSKETEYGKGSATRPSEIPKSEVDENHDAINWPSDQVKKPRITAKEVWYTTKTRARTCNAIECDKVCKTCMFAASNQKAFDKWIKGV